MDYVVQLIGEAWDHHRRRRRRLYLAGATLLAVAAVAAAVVPGSAGTARNVTTGFSVPVGTIRISASAAFSQSPYMGVNCPVPNSISCDRVGLAVWLRHPAYSVDASIAGASFPLTWFGDEYRFGARRKPRRAFDGYLQPAGIMSRLHVRPTAGGIWDGNGTPYPMVWVLINYGEGHHALTHLRVPLMAGWG